MHFGPNFFKFNKLSLHAKFLFVAQLKTNLNFHTI